MSLHLVILFVRRLRLTRVLYGHFKAGNEQRGFYNSLLSIATIYAFAHVTNVENS
jgi:hypothetical protein